MWSEEWEVTDGGEKADDRLCVTVPQMNVWKFFAELIFGTAIGDSSLTFC